MDIDAVIAAAKRYRELCEEIERLDLSIKATEDQLEGMVIKYQALRGEAVRLDEELRKTVLGQVDSEETEFGDDR